MMWVEVAGPHLEAVRKKETEFQAKYGAEVDAMIDYFFADLPTPETFPNGATAGVPTAANPVH
jgi:hypothetical protein